MPYVPTAAGAATYAAFASYLTDLGFAFALPADPSRWIALADAIYSVLGGVTPIPGPPKLTPSPKAAAFAATAGFHYRCTGTTYAATLVAGAGVAGQMCSVKNISATLVTVTCSGADLIDGSAATLPLVAGECALLVAHATGWDLV